MRTWIVPQATLLRVVFAVHSPIVLVSTFSRGRNSVSLINPLCTVPLGDWALVLIILTRGGLYGNTVKNNSYWASQPYSSHGVVVDLLVLLNCNGK